MPLKPGQLQVRGLRIPTGDLDALGLIADWLQLPGDIGLSLSLQWLQFGTTGRLGQADAIGAQLVNPKAGIQPANVQKPQNAVAIAAETTIWTPTPGTRFRVLGWFLASSVVGNVILRDNTGGTIIAVIPCGTAGLAVVSPDLGAGLRSAAPGNVLTATGPAASTLSGNVFGTEET